MHFISHRGNISGPNPKLENSKDYIIGAIKKGFEVEVDVWFNNNDFFLGHDSPLYKIEKEFLSENKIWCHAKNLKAFENLIDIKAHCFWHQEDDFVLTNRGYIWTFPGKSTGLKSIIVLPELIENFEFTKCSGVCSDYIQKFKNEYENK